jgi:hypothetical protein
MCPILFSVEYQKGDQVPRALESKLTCLVARQSNGTGAVWAGRAGGAEFAERLT